MVVCITIDYHVTRHNTVLHRQIARQRHRAAFSVLFARLHLRVSVDDADTELIGQFERLRSLLCRQSVAELSHVAVVVHQQHLQIGGRFDEEFVLSVRFASVAIAFGGTVPDIGHLARAVPSAANARVDTARFPPRSTNALIAVRMPTDKALGTRLGLLSPSSPNGTRLSRITSHV